MSLASVASNSSRRIRVMIVDDSAVVRGLARRWLETEPRIDLVKLCADGEQAVAEAASCTPDIILLDVEMPRLDGLAALPLIRKAVPNARIIMASSLTSRGAATTIKALSLGAADYIAKPDASSLGSADVYRRDLIEKIVALAPRIPATDPVQRAAVAASFKLRQPPARAVAKPLALVIAASTGGPQALQAFLQPIARRIDAPILIVQHMPASFTPVFAEKLGQVCGKPCREARDDEPVLPGSLLLAPGDWHMRLDQKGGGINIRLDQSPAVNFCRPAADPLFESAAQIYGPRLAAIVLTGMGADGRAGCGRIVEAGGRIAVQDEATSVVWGMPGAVALAGYAEAVEPLEALSQRALRLMNGDVA